VIQVPQVKLDRLEPLVPLVQQDPRVIQAILDQKAFKELLVPQEPLDPKAILAILVPLDQKDRRDCRDWKEPLDPLVQMEPLAP
jgi:hypothetical protein